MFLEKIGISEQIFACSVKKLMLVWKETVQDLIKTVETT